MNEGGKTSEALEVAKNFLNNIKDSRALLIKAEGRLGKEVKERSGIKFISNPDEWEDGTCFVFESNIFETISELMKDLIQNNDENKRYIFILQDLLLTSATLASQRLPPEYTTKKENTAKINSKLNQILQVLQALVNSRNASLKSYYGTDTGVNMLNRQLDTTRAELIRHSDILKKSDLEKETKAAMIEYSLEKNSSSRNLLGIYVFMNVVAAGLIFYLYRGAEAQ